MPAIEQILYIDPQRQPPAGQCAICGGLVYAPSCRCSRCERDSL